MAALLTDDEYQAIVDKHPGVRLRRVPTPAGEMVIRAPTPLEESTYQSMFFSQMHAGQCWRNLLMMLAVHPDKAQMKAWLDAWPGIPLNVRIIRELRIIRGEADEEEGK